jgi:hypothetical protein
LLSIAPSSVYVRKSRFGIFGPTLYKEKVAYRAALTAQAMSFRFRDSLLPSKFGRNPVLRAFTNAILHCATCAEVSATLKAATANAEQQEAGDKKMISDFAALMATEKLQAALILDVTMLQYPKEAILRAFEREIVREPLAARVEWLKTGAAFLAGFQERAALYPSALTGTVDRPWHNRFPRTALSLASVVRDAGGDPRGGRQGRWRRVPLHIERLSRGPVAGSAGLDVRPGEVPRSAAADRIAFC